MFRPIHFVSTYRRDIQCPLSERPRATTPWSLAHNQSNDPCLRLIVPSNRCILSIRAHAYRCSEHEYLNSAGYVFAGFTLMWVVWHGNTLSSRMLRHDFTKLHYCTSDQSWPTLKSLLCLLNLVTVRPIALNARTIMRNILNRILTRSLFQVRVVRHAHVATFVFRTQ